MAFVLTVPPAALIEGRRLFLEPVVDFFFRLIVTVKPFAGRAFGHASKTDDSQLGSAVFSAASSLRVAHCRHEIDRRNAVAAICLADRVWAAFSFRSWSDKSRRV